MLYDLKETLEGEVLDVILEKLGYKVQPYEAEELAEEIVKRVEDYLISKLRGE